MCHWIGRERAGVKKNRLSVDTLKLTLTGHCLSTSSFNYFSIFQQRKTMRVVKIQEMEVSCEAEQMSWENYFFTFLSSHIGWGWRKINFIFNSHHIPLKWISMTMCIHVKASVWVDSKFLLPSLLIFYDSFWGGSWNCGQLY